MDGKNIKRGKIYLASLDPSFGSEISKTRPVLVVSNDLNNKHSSTVSILPITSNIDKVFPFDVYVEKGEGNLPKPSKIKADQIRTIDKMRIVKEIGELTNSRMDEIENAICIHLSIKYKI